MPGIDGFGVLEYLDRCKPEVMAHTIISSGLPEKYRERVARYGVCGVVAKPLDHRALQEMLAPLRSTRTDAAKDRERQAKRISDRRRGSARTPSATDH